MKSENSGIWEKREIVFMGPVALFAILLFTLSLNSCGTENDTTGAPAVNNEAINNAMFKYTHSAGPCSPGRDCYGFVALTSDGILIVDKFGETPSGSLHTAKISQADFDVAVPVLTAGSLIELLDTPGQICPVGYDINSDITVNIDNIRHYHDTSFCSNLPIINAQNMANFLESKYAP